MTKREALSNRVLTEREVSDLRAVRTVYTSRELLALVERIVAEHVARARVAAYQEAVAAMMAHYDAPRRKRLKWVDLFGIDPDYTDGKPVDEWLEQNRGEA